MPVLISEPDSDSEEEDESDDDESMGDFVCNSDCSFAGIFFGEGRTAGFVGDFFGTASTTFVCDPTLGPDSDLLSVSEDEEADDDESFMGDCARDSNCGLAGAFSGEL